MLGMKDVAGYLRREKNRGRREKERERERVGGVLKRERSVCIFILEFGLPSVIF